VRGAIFDILGQFFTEETRVLDLYAGTGALGIEALSRGAGWADFVEQQPRCCAAIRENLTAAGLGDRAKVHCRAAGRAVAGLVGPYGLVFMDPPYARPPDPSLVRGLSAVGALEPDVRVVVEHARRTEVPADFGGLSLARQRRHGDTMISVFEPASRPALPYEGAASGQGGLSG
jgi:16S rRNA (guanine966-N2)-methyltransferase